jgi:hypothetical protein
MKIKRANGTMLILVVAFMLILIVFCMATLAMVTVANSRAVTKFEENQSYYTAASALEVFANGTLSDETYYAVNGLTPRNYYKADGTPIAQMTQGRALELDLYKLVVWGDGSSTKPIGEGEKGTSPIFPTTGSYKDLNNIINTTTNSVFSASFASTYGEQFTANSGYKYAEYTIALPSVSSGDNYGLFADTQTLSDGTKYQAKIKVEVLERYYNMAGVEQEALEAYMEAALTTPPSITDDQATDVKAIFGTGWNATSPKSSTPNATAINAAIAGGQRHKDYFRIRVTSEAELLGVKGVTAREYVVQEIPTDDFDSSNISSGGIGNNDQNNVMNMTGGAASMLNFNLTVPGQIGPFYAEQDYFMSQTGTTYLSPLDYIFAKGHVIIGNAGATDTVVTNGNGAYIYGAKGVYIAGSAGLGGTPASSNPISVLSGGIFDFSNPITIHGDIIADGLRYRTNQDKLQITGKTYVNDFYVPSSSMTNAITIDGLTTPADIHVAEAIYLDYDPFDNDGDTSTIMYLSVGDAKIIANGTAAVYSRSGAITGTSMGTVSQLLSPTGLNGFGLNSANVSTGSVDTVKLDYFNSAHYSVVTDAKGLINRQFKLPNSLTLYLATDDTVRMPTTQSKFNKIMYSSFFTTNGDLATGSGTNVSAWDNSLTWNNPFDSNATIPGVSTPRNSSSYFQTGVTYSGTTVPGAAMSFYGDTYGRYPTAAINAALRTAEAEYEMKVKGTAEAAAAALFPSITSTVGYFNKQSAAAPMGTDVAKYDYSGSTNGSVFKETFTEEMPDGKRIIGSGILDSSSLSSYGNPPTVYIDTNAGGAIELQVNGKFEGNYIILGDGRVTFLINGNPGDTLYAGDDLTNWKGVLIMREKNYAMWLAGVTFGVGEVTVAEKSSIGNTTVYVSSGTEFKLCEGGSQFPTCIAANIIAFQSKVSNNANDVVNIKADYNGITKTYAYSTIGTVTSNNYTKLNNNRSGNLFMASDVPPEDGKPNFDWNVIRYLSGQN